MKLTLEIRAAEGGEDSKLFVRDLADAYIRYFNRVGWLHRIVDRRDGEIHIEVSGGNDLSKLKNECGGHRIQRVPPTERKGRVHTSTVTVAVITNNAGPETTEKSFEIPDKDIKIEWFSGTGAGGQHRNKHQNSCRLTHIPTGTIETAQTRSREGSYRAALESLKKKIYNESARKANNEISLIRKEQVGSGMRGDKIRTYRFRDNIVKDDISGKTASCDKIMKGNFDLLWR